MPEEAMTTGALTHAVTALAETVVGYADADLAQPFAWGPHREGVRMAVLGTYHELRDLAARLAAQRAAGGLPLTVAQRILGQIHAAYRDLQAVLLGVPAAAFEPEPGPGQWPLRIVVGHIVATERHFFALVHYALQRRTDPDLPAALPDDEVDRLTGPAAPFYELMEQGPVPELLAYYARHHQRVLAAFSGIADADLAATTVWWEGPAFDLHHRLHRFDAHLRQHIVQVEQTLAALAHAPTEAQRLARPLLSALAEVEGAALGTAGLAAEETTGLAARIRARTERAAAVVEAARDLLAAVTTGDLATVQAILAHHPELVDARSQQGVSAVLTATYHRQPAMAAALVEAGAHLSAHDAAAIGALTRLQEIAGRRPGDLHQFAADGFTPLQLACYFGQTEVARWLLEQGADVHAVARNEMRIQPIHAATAAGQEAIVSALLNYGADANARQQHDLTPLHAAAQGGREALVRRLLAAGADPAAVDDQGRDARALATAAGHRHIASLLAAGRGT